MFVEQKKVIQIGGSAGVTIKPNAGLMLKQGEEVTVEYHKDKIIIKRVK